MITKNRITTEEMALSVELLHHCPNCQLLPSLRELNELQNEQSNRRQGWIPLWNPSI